MIGSRSARLGIGAESHAAQPLCISRRHTQIALQRRRLCAHRLVLNRAVASDSASASALSTRFEEFILKTQHAIIEVTALHMERGDFAQPAGMDAGTGQCTTMTAGLVARSRTRCGTGDGRAGRRRGIVPA